MQNTTGFGTQMPCCWSVQIYTARLLQGGPLPVINGVITPFIADRGPPCRLLEASIFSSSLMAQTLHLGCFPW